MWLEQLGLAHTKPESYDVSLNGEPVPRNFDFKKMEFFREERIIVQLFVRDEEDSEESEVEADDEPMEEEKVETRAVESQTQATGPERKDVESQTEPV